jgi:lipoprotein NlpI
MLLGMLSLSCKKQTVSDLDRGMGHFQRGEYQMAIWHLGNHLRKNSGHAEGYAHRGTARFRTGDVDGALADFDRALELNPALAHVHLERGMAHTIEGHLDKAIEDFDSMIELAPKNTDAYYCRANLRTETGDLDGAIADYTRALQFEPAGALIHFNRGIAHYLRRNWERARSDFEAAARLQPPQHYGLLYACVLKARLGAGEAARELQDEVRRLADPKPAEWFTIVARFLTGEMDETALLTAAHEGGISGARSKLCEAWYFAGMAHRLAGREAEAAKCFRRSTGTGMKNYAEYSFSSTELEVIEGRLPALTDAAASPSGEVFRGKIHRIDARSVMLRDKKNGDVRHFTIGERTQVTLDGAAASVRQIKPAMDAVITQDGNGAVKAVDGTTRR